MNTQPLPPSPGKTEPGRRRTFALIVSSAGEPPKITADPRLEQARALMQQEPLLLNEAERSFTETSIREKSRRVRRTRLIVAGVILGLAGLAGAAWWQHTTAPFRPDAALASIASRDGSVAPASSSTVHRQGNSVELHSNLDHKDSHVA